MIRCLISSLALLLPWLLLQMRVRRLQRGKLRNRFSVTVVVYLTVIRPNLQGTEQKLGFTCALNLRKHSILSEVLWISNENME